MTDTLIAFLTARLNEDEAAAKACSDSGPWTVIRGDGSWGDDRIVTATADIAECGPGDSAHIARHDPPRALREVEAGRQIMAEHGDREDSIWCRTCDPARDDMNDSASYFPCRTLRILAAVYSDHPDYQLEWAAGD